MSAKLGASSDTPSLRPGGVAASRLVLVKGANPANAIAFLIDFTNLVIELGVVLWVLAGSSLGGKTLSMMRRFCLTMRI